MEIPVSIRLSDSADGNGKKLWVMAEDGTNRVWSRWYQDGHSAFIDVERMDLLEEAATKPSAGKYLRGLNRELLHRPTMDDGVLNSQWERASSVSPTSPS